MFMQGHGIEGDIKVLSQLEAMAGFIKGANLQAPGIESNLGFDLYKKNYTKSSDDVNFGLSFSPMGSRYNLGFVQAYNLGFRVAVARDYGVTLEASEIPADDHQHALFVQGLKGEARRREYCTFVEALNRDIARSDTKIYEAGLNVWLQHQGIKSVKAKQISDPEALRAFKAALSGEVLPNYEPKPITEDDLKMIHSKSSIIDSYLNKFNPETSLEPAHRSREPRIDLIKAIGQIGYDLGKKARDELQI